MFSEVDKFRKKEGLLKFRKNERIKASREAKISVGRITVTPEEAPLPLKAEHLKTEKLKPVKGREVSRKIMKKYYKYLRSVLKKFSPRDIKVATDVLFGRAYQQNEMGTSPEDTMKYIKVLKESGDLAALAKRALELHKAGDEEAEDSFKFWVDKNIRDRTRTSKDKEMLGEKYLGIEKEAISSEMRDLIADFEPLPMEEAPVAVAEVERELTDAEYADLLAQLDEMAKGAGEEWEGEPTPSPEESAIADIRELRKALAEEEMIATDIEELDEEW